MHKSLADRQKDLRKAILAMLKLRFSLSDIRSMYEKDMEDYFAAYDEMMNPSKGKTYKVRKRSV